MVRTNSFFLFNFYRVLHELGGWHLRSLSESIYCRNTPAITGFYYFSGINTRLARMFSFCWIRISFEFRGLVQLDMAWGGTRRGLHYSARRQAIHQPSQLALGCVLPLSQLNLLDFCTGVGVRLANINSSQITQMRTNCK